MDTIRTKTLPPPARYFPPRGGQYRVTPDLYALSTDFGNGEADRRVFQIDRDYDAYLTGKATARAEDLHKYYRDALDDNARRIIHAFLVRQLCAEYPRWFTRHEADGGVRLECRLTGEDLEFDADFAWRGSRSRAAPAHASGLDALACQVQEDICILQGRGENNRLRAAHLCFPNHWAAADKFGRPFREMHRPVAGMEDINRRSETLIDALIQRGPYVRFAWGLATDTRLNHHPEPPPHEDPEHWAGRDFAPGKDPIYMRVERQTLHGLPDIDALLFTIRTSFVDVNQLREQDPTRCRQLAAALASMSPAQLAYKGLAAARDALVAWLGDSA